MVVSLLNWYADHAAALVVVVVVAAIAGEKVRLWSRRRDLDLESTGTSVIAAGAFFVVKTLAGKALFLGLAIWLYERHRLFDLDLSDPVVWLVVFAIRDLVYYWVHRAEHGIRALWASHLIHHSPETIGPSTAIRVPWMEALYKPWFALWMPLIGFNPILAIAFDAFAAILGVWQHQPRSRRHALLGTVFVTPSAHRVHHGSNAEYIDRNFGAVLIVWDRLFGTFQAESAPVRFGIGSATLDTPHDVLVGGFPALAEGMRTRQGVAAKFGYLAGRPI